MKDLVHILPRIFNVAQGHEKRMNNSNQDVGLKSGIRAQVRPPNSENTSHAAKRIFFKLIICSLCSAVAWGQPQVGDKAFHKPDEWYPPAGRPPVPCDVRRCGLPTPFRIWECKRPSPRSTNAIYPNINSGAIGMALQERAVRDSECLRSVITALVLHRVQVFVGNSIFNPN